MTQEVEVLLATQQSILTAKLAFLVLHLKYRFCTSIYYIFFSLVKFPFLSFYRYKYIMGQEFTYNEVVSPTSDNVFTEM